MTIVNLLAQIHGADEAINAAAAEGWTAIAVVIVLLTTLGTCGWVMRMLWVQNSSLSQRITALEGTIETKLLEVVAESAKVVSSNTTVMARVIDTLDRLERAVATTPCLMQHAFSEETRKRIEASKQAAGVKSE